MGKQSNKVFFYADSENPADSGYSPPGDPYPDASPRLQDAFQSYLPFTEGPMRDKWGAWVSALAPVVDPKTNKVVAVAGIDIPAQNYYWGIATIALVPLLLAAIPVAGLLRDRKVEKKEWEIANLKNQFVSVASHELRSPLSGMLWAVQSLLKPYSANLTPQQTTLLQDMYRSTESSMATVNEILDLSIFERGKQMKHDTETIDLVGIIHDVQKTLSLGAQEKSIDIVMAETWPASALTTGNMAAIKRAIMNVVSNAIKYSPASSTVTISYRTADKQHIIGILDRGIGIPKADQAKVLGGYYRAPNATKLQANGTGIGLFLTKLIIEEHQGKVWIESVESKGTSVFVSLPVATGPKKPSPARTTDQASI
jgi:signal transduction histidine kinase